MGHRSFAITASGFTLIPPILVGLATLLTASASAERSTVQTVATVDFNAYVGRWHEIARIENEFEIGCTEVTAEYSRNDDGTFQVVNTCRYGATPDARTKRSEARAWIPDPQSPGKVKVTFVKLFRWLKIFAGDYWILHLGPLNADGQYEYALVGHPKRRYGWVLARTPQLGEDQLNEVFAHAERQGYDRKNFNRMDPRAAP